MQKHEQIGLGNYMKTQSRKPLVTGLIGANSGMVYAQVEVYTRGANTLDFVIRRRSYSGREGYSGLPDIEFSIDDRDLEEVINIFNQAKGKLTTHWISRLATGLRREYPEE